MSTSLHQCRIPGCGTVVPAELETEGYCVSHYLSSAEQVCMEMRRETAVAGPDESRRAELETYVAAAAMKLALIGTGRVRLSDEIKKRVLTTFLTLMILRENLDKAANTFMPRSRAARPELNTAAATARM